ncbi:MAG TPA: phosphoribosyltransferase family protein [Saprospiraceae bacterium]|nr:phosphoribosyltransferase family protein [Saprospiraceae bacterium]
MNEIRLHDLVFEPFISAAEIKQIVDGLADRIDRDYAGKNPVLLIVLNGAFIFAADLVRRISIPIRLDFVKISSYDGTASSGNLKEHFVWQTSLRDEHVIIVEDIVDTGHTLAHLKNKIQKENPASVEIVCLLFKPDAYQYKESLQYPGRAIPNDFVVGYGLDYNGLGRDLDCIYRKKA